MKTNFSLLRSAISGMVIMLVFCFFTSPMLHAQDQGYNTPDLRKWSLQIHANNFMGNTTLPLTPFTGSLGAESRFFNPGAGFSLEYAFSPSFALKAEYNFSLIENDSDSPAYKNQYQSVGLGINVYLLESLHLYRFGDRLNPFVSLFAGHSHNSLSNMVNRDDDQYWYGHYGLGLGTRIRLGDRLDWILAYQYKFFNYQGKIDGGVAGSDIEIFQSDRLAGITTGVSIKLGSPDRHHAAWYTPRHETEQLFQQMAELEQAQQRQFEAIQREWSQQEQRLQTMLREVPSEDPDAVRRRELVAAQNQINQLLERVAGLERQLAEVDEPRERPDPQTLIREPGDDLPAGYYVQTFAGRSLERTNQALELTRSGLAAQGVDTDRLRFHIHQLPNGLYTVQIGPYQSSEQALTIRNQARQVFDDSYIYRHRP